MSDVSNLFATEMQCTALNHAFAYHQDRGEFEEMIALFTADGTFNRDGQLLQGQSDIRKAMADRPTGVTTRHMVTNIHFLEVGEDLVEAVVYCMTYHAMAPFEGEPLPYGTDQGRLIEFHDRYRRTPHGWRISSRDVQVIFKPAVWP